MSDCAIVLASHNAACTLSFSLMLAAGYWLWKSRRCGRAAVSALLCPWWCHPTVMVAIRLRNPAATWQQRPDEGLSPMLPASLGKPQCSIPVLRRRPLAVALLVM